MKITKTLAILLLAVSYAGAEDIKVDFDGKRSAPDFASLGEMVENAVPEVKTGDLIAKEASRLATRGWYKSKVCKTVELNSNDGASINRRISLDAAYTWQECVDTTAIVNGQYVSVSECHDETQWYDASVDLVIHNRQLRQFEKERVEVCYDFKSQKGSFALRQTPFEYTYRDKSNSWHYSVELFPGARTPQAPEASVAELGGLSYDDVRGEFTLTVLNRFTGDYDGGKIHIGVELVQDKMFDSSKGVKFFEFPLNWLRQNFKMIFKLSDFASDKEAADFKAKADKFYVKWGFKVKKEGFTEVYTEKGKTDRVSVIR